VKLTDARKDKYRKLAKKEGYRSRSSYKLIDINSKYNIIKHGFKVIDFGCAPGGWLQVAAEIVGDTGFVLGIDIKPVSYIGNNVKSIILNINDINFENITKNYLNKKVNVVLSDIAPNISGIWQIDHSRQIDLTMNIINLFSKILVPKGSCILKIFEGELSNIVVNKMREMFTKVKIVKPSASRKSSSEFYIVAIGYSNIS
jgi:23S rRNA (uridine2552-2'-O)-methyltransferase